MARRALRPVLAGRRPRGPRARSPRATSAGLEAAVGRRRRPAESLRGLVDRGDVLVQRRRPVSRALGGASRRRRRPSTRRRPLPRRPPGSRPSSAPGLRGQAAAASARAAGVAAPHRHGLRRRPRQPRRRPRPARRGTRRPCPGQDSAARRRRSCGGISRAAAAAVERRPACASPSFAWRGGRLVERARRHGRVGAFEVEGRIRRGVSAGTSESFSLPQLHPGLTEVDVYLGWLGLGAGSRGRCGRCRPSARLSLAFPAPRRPCPRWRTVSRSGAPVGGLIEEARARTRSLFVAEALDPAGAVISSVVLEGGDGYEFSGAMLAWAAERVLAGEARGTGALGPVEAFRSRRPGVRRGRVRHVQASGTRRNPQIAGIRLDDPFNTQNRLLISSRFAHRLRAV